MLKEKKSYFSCVLWFASMYLDIWVSVGAPITLTLHWVVYFFFFIVSESHSVVSTLCDPMDCIVRGIFQARVLEWVAFPFSSGLSQPRNQTRVSCIAGGFFTNWAMREALFIVDWVQLQRITLILRVKLKNKSHICCFRKNLLQNA